ncbi:hypothetical protein [Aeromonas caviae]|uniref:hypothetical protein n=1 Tax=Aeromonas caviae TaxID=648 RepID=UPI002B49FB44|nr:hypothetical protein [Aeromonas caviae]
MLLQNKKSILLIGGVYSMEIPKRLQPTTDTLRRLYSLSGNQCAFPGCNRAMFNSEGNFIGQICHIESALSGGERFNARMTNDDRRAFDNLMLMCYDHHIETDKVDIYPVSKMKEMKRQHEEVYSNIDRFVHQMQSTIEDVTTNISAGRVQSLSNLYISLYGLDNRELDEISEDVDIFNAAIHTLSKFSPDAKKIFAISLSRARNVVNILGFTTDELFVDPYEIERVTQLDKTYLRSIFREIESSQFLVLDEDEEVFHICQPKSEVNFWAMIKQFCNVKNLDVALMVSNLNFVALD